MFGNAIKRDSFIPLNRSCLTLDEWSVRKTASLGAHTLALVRYSINDRDFIGLMLNLRKWILSGFFMMFVSSAFQCRLNSCPRKYFGFKSSEEIL